MVPAAKTDDSEKICFARTQSLYKQELKLSLDTWYKQGLLIKDGIAIGTLNGQQMFNITVPGSPAPQNGFVGLGTASYGLADFDNLKIMNSSDGERKVLSDIKINKKVKTPAHLPGAGDNVDVRYSVKEIEHLEISEGHYVEDTLYFKSLSTDEE